LDLGTGVSIAFNGWTNVKGRPSINILGVFASGAIFLSTHDYLVCYKIGINIAKPLIKTIQEIGLCNVFQGIIDNVANCKATKAIIEDMYPNIFWSVCLVHTLNLLMHDIIKMKNHDYKWIGALYKKGKRNIKFIPIIAMLTTFSSITLSWSYLRLQRPNVLAIISPFGFF